MAEPQGANDVDRRRLITTILRHQDLDSLLRLSVVLCDLELAGDGCSLFLYDSEHGEIVLKESTVLTRFLGQGQAINVAEERTRVEKIRDLLALHSVLPERLDGPLRREQAEPWGAELVQALHRFGLTRWSYWFGCPLLVEREREDLRWASYSSGDPQPASWGDATNEPIPGARTGSGGLTHCELSEAELGSILVVPIGSGADRPPRAVLRVVRKNSRDVFREADLEWLKWFAALVDSCMEVAISLSDLTDLGTRLDVADFGSTLVHLLQKVLSAKGCSIFLEMEPPKAALRTFQCIATTGLVADGHVVDKSQARYEVDLSQPGSEYLTSWVLRHGQLVALADIHSFNANDFPRLQQRHAGRGKFSETDGNGVKFDPGPILISPLFLHEGTEAAGAIRVVRPRGETFQVHEQLLFLDISRRLSRVLTNLHLRQVSENLVNLYNDPEEMLKRVPREVCRLLGVEGCSVFLTKPGKQLVLEATSGVLAGQEGKLAYRYDSEPDSGWTGWVANTKMPLLLNSPQEAETKSPPAKHSKEGQRPCEIGGKAYRFLAVPILREDASAEALGVIRVPRRKEDPAFREEVHQSILVSFAARLSLALNLAQKLADIRLGLVEVGREMTIESSPLKHKLQVIAEAAARVTLADNVIIHEYVGPHPDDDGLQGRFRESASGGTRQPWRWQEGPFRRDAVPFRVVASQEPLFAEIAEKSAILFHQKADPNFIQREGIRSVAALPLKVEATCVGCIFFNFVNAQKFVAQKRQEIQMMAEYAAIAIYQGRLLEETQKLTREKSNLLRYAEHSLNQPLTALLGYLSNLAEGVYYDSLQPHDLRDPEQFKKSILAEEAEQYHQLCQYMNYLITTFLRIDRLEMERRESRSWEPVEEDLFQVVRIAGQDLSSVCRQAASVAAAYRLSPIDQQVPAPVLGELDQDAIQIALLNVLVNAVKHGTPSDGRRDVIRLTLSTVEREGRIWAEIRVEDSGPGVDPDERERIFERHYSTGSHPAGLGIGLFLTRGYVEAHGGTVSVDESVSLGGARFTLHFPLTAPKEPPHVA